MSTVIQIAPVRKSIHVKASPQHAFEVFTAGIDRWWPKTHNIVDSPVRKTAMEPSAGGRWYTIAEDGTEVTVGRILVWEPGQRLVCSWDVTAEWKPESRPEFSSEFEIRFKAVDGGTLVELEHRNFERMGARNGETARAGLDGGWPGVLQLFAAAVDA